MSKWNPFLWTKWIFFFYPGKRYYILTEGSPDFPKGAMLGGYCTTGVGIQGVPATSCCTNIFRPTHGIESWNHRTVWVGRDFKDHLAPTPMPRTGTCSPRAGCSKPHPTWPWTQYSITRTLQYPITYTKAVPFGMKGGKPRSYTGWRDKDMLARTLARWLL